jgi:hypothetical protein
LGGLHPGRLIQHVCVVMVMPNLLLVETAEGVADGLGGVAEISSACGVWRSFSSPVKTVGAVLCWRCHNLAGAVFGPIFAMMRQCDSGGFSTRFGTAAGLWHVWRRVVRGWGWHFLPSFTGS